MQVSFYRAKITGGFTMKTNKEILSSIVKTAQMGQVGIRSVMDYARSTNLRKALHSQLQEYDMIEQEAQQIASMRGWDIQELDPAAKLMSKAYSRANLMVGNVDSRIAAMMINGNTRGLIKGIKNQHHGNQSDLRVRKLSDRLLSYETANIRQMQEYL